MTLDVGRWTLDVRERGEQNMTNDGGRSRAGTLALMTADYCSIAGTAKHDY